MKEMQWYRTLCPDCGHLYFTMQPEPRPDAKIPCEACHKYVPIEACEKPTQEEWVLARNHAADQPSCVVDYLKVEA